ncbi:MAG: hypothetical protein GY800_02170 [Planctomycetes bacterium]|nr:hypothetical protein [Planctomycetota bacterium]
MFGDTPELPAGASATPTAEGMTPPVVGDGVPAAPAAPAGDFLKPQGDPVVKQGNETYAQLIARGWTKETLTQHGYI